MTPDELTQKVWDLVDEHCQDMANSEYLEALQDIRDHAAIRAEGIEQEIADAQ